MDDGWPEIDGATLELERPADGVGRQGGGGETSAAEALVRNRDKTRFLVSKFGPFLDAAVGVAFRAERERAEALRNGWGGEFERSPGLGSWGKDEGEDQEEQGKKLELGPDWAPETLRTARTDPFALARYASSGQDECLTTAFIRADTLLKFLSQVESVEEYSRCVTDLPDSRLVVPLQWLWQQVRPPCVRGEKRSDGRVRLLLSSSLALLCSALLCSVLLCSAMQYLSCAVREWFEGKASPVLFVALGLGRDWTRVRSKALD